MRPWEAMGGRGRPRNVDLGHRAMMKRPTDMTHETAGAARGGCSPEGDCIAFRRVEAGVRFTSGAAVRRVLSRRAPADVKGIAA